MAASKKEQGAADRLLPLGSQDSDAPSAGSPKSTSGRKIADGSKGAGGADRKEKPAASERGKGRMKPLDIMGPDTMERGTRGSDRPPAVSPPPASPPPIRARLSAAAASTRRLSAAAASTAAALIPGTPAENDERPCWKKKRCYIVGLLGCLGCWGIFALIRYINTEAVTDKETNPPLEPPADTDKQTSAQVCGPDKPDCPDSLVCTDDSDSEPVGLDRFGKLEKAGTCQKQACTGGDPDEKVCRNTNYACYDGGGKKVGKGQPGSCHWDEAIKKEGEECGPGIACRGGFICFGFTADGKKAAQQTCQNQACNADNIKGLYSVDTLFGQDVRDTAADACERRISAQAAVLSAIKWLHDETTRAQANKLRRLFEHPPNDKIDRARAMTICANTKSELQCQATRLCLDEKIRGSAAAAIMMKYQGLTPQAKQAAELCRKGVPSALALQIMDTYDNQPKRLEVVKELDLTDSWKAVTRWQEIRKQEIAKQPN